MPELPEVETTINDLKPFVLGKRIENVDVLWKGTISEPSVEQFRQGLRGRKIVDITRRGKHLIFELDNNTYWIVHMRMTGSLLLKRADEEPGNSVRVVIYLNDQTAIHFRDMRRFGKMWLVKDKDSVVGKLGPEPLDPHFTPELLEQLLHGRKVAIKGLLLDQTFIAGIGNMYADEALYDARIHPLRLAGSLTRKEISRLHASIQKVLKQGILNKGASTETYIRPEGIKGEAHLKFQVAHRKGKECPVCGGPIERITVHQRGTFFCPYCQKLPRNQTTPSGRRKITSGSVSGPK
jgi:formamidopyrimidine-DNA glycosylase